MKTSATGGYALPGVTATPPNGLDLTQFIQSVLVGISGLDGTLVRPLWQPKPPKQPDINVNWISFGISSDEPDANGYLNTSQASDVDPTVTAYGRQSTLEIQLKFWGPRALDFYQIVRDGFQIPQNYGQLKRANFGFIEILSATRVPDLIDELWFNKFESVLRFHYTTNRTYPILSLATASGTIYTQTSSDSNYQQNFNAEDD